MTEEPRRALVVEDHALLAQSLVLALTREDITATWVGEPIAEAVLETADAFAPDVALVDLDLGDAGDGMALVAPLTARGITVVIMTGQESRVRHATCVEAGAVGVVQKSQPFSELVDAVRRAAAGEALLSGEARSTLLVELAQHRREEEQRYAPLARLSPREQAVLDELMDGRTATEIAEDAVVSVATVRSQVRSILQKLGVNSQLAAVGMARRAGWHRNR